MTGASDHSAVFDLPSDVEEARLRSLRQVHLIDTEPEERFARITRMARSVFGVPMAAVSLIDGHRQWFKQNDGLEGLGCEVPRRQTVCQATIARCYQQPEELELVLDDAAAHPQFAAVPGVGGDGGVRFYAGYPLFGPGGHPIGTFCIYDTVPRSLDERQLAGFREMATWVQREVEQSDDLERAAAIQRRLLPRPLQDLPGYVVRSMCIPAYAVGGDFYDHYPARRGAVFTVADVMGKGLGAAIVAASVRSALRAATAAADQLTQDSDLGDIVGAVGTLAAEDLANTETFVTLFHARLDIVNHTLTCVDAGHGLAVLLRSDGRVEPLNGSGLPLGVVHGETWVSRTVVLGPGDLVVAVSDGTLDLVSDDIDIRQCIELVRANAHPDKLVQAVHDLVARRPPLDDVTLIAIGRDEL